MKKIILIMITMFTLLLCSCNSGDNSLQTSNGQIETNNELVKEEDIEVVSLESNEEKNGVVESPFLPENFVFRPTINIDEETNTAGIAFALNLTSASDTLIVTANHIMGEAGGFSTTYPSLELIDHFKTMDLYGLFNDEFHTSINKIIPIKSAKMITGKDVAAFIVENPEDYNALTAAESMPDVGDYVWLVAKVLDGADEDVIMHRALVTEYTNFTNALAFTYDNPKLSIQATSGAPIINQSGQVVGINIGGYKEDGKMVGVACGILTIKDLIEKSMLDMEQ